MGATSQQRVNELTQAITELLRQNKEPSQSDLVLDFPDLADQIPEYIDTLALLERAGGSLLRARKSKWMGFGIGRQKESIGGYRLVREIGRGGMGIVYEAEQPSLARHVALKVLPPYPTPSRSTLARFKREATAAARLHHSNIVPIFGAGEDDGVHFCVMQYIEGHSLASLMTDLRQELFGKVVVPNGDGEGTVPSGDREGTSTRSDPLQPEDPNSPTPLDELDSEIRLFDLAFTDAVSVNTLDSEVTPIDEFSNFSAVQMLANGQIPTERLRNPHKSTPIHELQAGVDLEDREFPSGDSSLVSYYRRIARLGASVAAAVDHAHRQGVLHRDIKPGNLILDRYGHIWVADFGLAKLIDDDDLTKSGNVVGTLRFSAPEQFSGRFDERSDIYSLGVTLHELLTLEHAFRGDDRKQLIHNILEGRLDRPIDAHREIPLDLRTIIQKAVRNDPAERYQTASELASDLRCYLSDRPVSARRVGRLGHAKRWCKRHRTETALGAFFAASTILLAMVSTIAYFRESRLREESDERSMSALAAIDRVFDTYIPDWTDSPTTSIDDFTSVGPASGQLLEGLVDFYDEMAEQEGRRSGKAAAVDRVFALRKVGLIFHRLGEFDKAKSYLGRALKQAELQETRTQDEDWLLTKAIVQNEIGAVFWTNREIKEAESLHRDSLRALEELRAKTEAFSEEHQFVLAKTWYMIGRRGRGRLGGAPLRPVITREQEDYDKRQRKERLQAIDEAVVILHNLVSRNPENRDFRLLLALSYRELSDGRLDDQGHPLDKRLSRSIELLRQLVTEDPRNPSYQFALCKTLQWLSLYGTPTDARFAAALRRLKESNNLARRLSLARPDEWIYAAARVESFLLLAETGEKTGELEQARDDSLRAAQIGMQLMRKYPDSLPFRYWTGYAHLLLGRLQMKNGDLRSSCGSLSESEKLLKEALDEKPAWGHVILGNLKTNLETHAAALDHLGHPEQAAHLKEQAQKLATLHEAELSGSLSTFSSFSMGLHDGTSFDLSGD